MKRLVISLTLLTIGLAIVLGSGTFAAKKNPVLGFSQLGAESEWRVACTRSIQGSAKDYGFTLIFSDAQQKQQNQIAALRSFIARKVDAIGLTCVVESGWGPVLREIKAANIPLIMIDRGSDEKDTSLWVTLIGSDFTEEGRKTAKWLGTYLAKKGIDDGKKEIKIDELQGTTGSAPALDRKKGFEEVMNAEHPNWKIVRSETGNFTASEGKTVMQAFLKADKDFQVLYAHNDQMALGAIQAIKEAGMKPGKDMTIVSIDGVKGAFIAMMAGELNASIECNPLLGPQMYQAALDTLAGKELPKYIPTIEGVFDESNAAAAFPHRQY
ncbi:MAG TPA: ABC transporter substrate-binding protein [Syntrophales bacterium]|nr:ABC transporter substrate-binding protein [Syntrophales bacterium]